MRYAYVMAAAAMVFGGGGLAWSLLGARETRLARLETRLAEVESREGGLTQKWMLERPVLGSPAGGRQGEGEARLPPEGFGGAGSGLGAGRPGDEWAGQEEEKSQEELELEGRDTLARYEEKFRREARGDRSVASDEDAIKTAFLELESASMELGSVECRQSSCRVEASFESLDEYNRVFKSLFMVHPDQRRIKQEGVIVPFVEDVGDRKSAVFFVTRAHDTG
jgi:hypothetical protein